jgi:hypothetical protein
LRSNLSRGDLQDPFEALQDLFGVLAFAPGRIVEGDSGRRAATPRTIIPRQGPEVAGLRLPPPGVEHRGAGLIHEQLG